MNTLAPAATAGKPIPDGDKRRAQLELFVIRCSEIAERIFVGHLGFIDGVDMAYSAAEWSDLTDTVGDDAIQKIMAAAFASAPRGELQS